MNIKRIGPALALTASLAAGAACSPESETNAAVPFSNMECVEPQQVDTAELVALGGAAISQVDQLTDPNLRAASVIFVREAISELTGLPTETTLGSGFVAEGDNSIAVVTTSEILGSQVRSEKAAMYIPGLGWLNLSGCALRDAAIPLQQITKAENPDEKTNVPVAITLPQAVQDEISETASLGEITPFTLYDLDHRPDFDGAQKEEEIIPVIPVYTNGNYLKAAIAMGGFSDAYTNYFGINTIDKDNGVTGDLCFQLLGAPVMRGMEVPGGKMEVFSDKRSKHYGRIVLGIISYVSSHTIDGECGDFVWALPFDYELIEEAGLLVGANG